MLILKENHPVQPKEPQYIHEAKTQGEKGHENEPTPGSGATSAAGVTTGPTFSTATRTTPSSTSAWASGPAGADAPVDVTGGMIMDGEEGVDVADETSSARASEITTTTATEAAAQEHKRGRVKGPNQKGLRLPHPKGQRPQATKDDDVALVMMVIFVDSFPKLSKKRLHLLAQRAFP